MFKVSSRLWGQMLPVAEENVLISQPLSPSCESPVVPVLKLMATPE